MIGARVGTEGDLQYRDSVRDSANSGMLMPKPRRVATEEEDKGEAMRGRAGPYVSGMRAVCGARDDKGTAFRESKLFLESTYAGAVTGRWRERLDEILTSSSAA